MATSSTLSTLKIVAVSRPSDKPAIQVKREKLINRISEQIHVAAARAKGATHVITETARVRDKDNGGMKEVQWLRSPKPWWWTGDDGKTYLTLRYGARVIELAKGKSAIEVGAISAIVPTLEKLKTAVQNAELDSVLEAHGLPSKKAK